jgi:hypothetical protein
VVLFGCFEFLVSVLELFLVVGRLYFKPWVGFVMLFFCSGFVLYFVSAICLYCSLCVSLVDSHFRLVEF